MSFFHPLRLGRRVRVVRRDDREDGRTQPAARRIAHEAWREGIPRVEWEYQEFREADELAALRRAPADEPPRRVRVILGEPGAGKSTLLGEWFRRWAETPETPRLGTPVPVFVRLSALNGRESLPGGEDLADLLWGQCCETAGSHLPDAVCATVYQPRRGRLFRPVWLLDGLDEVADERLAGVLVERLAGLPGTVAVSCRTAVFQQRHRDDARFVRDELEILPLTAPERLAFLTRTLGDEPRARDLAARIAANTQLAQLAGNPLMLDLIADVSTEVALPATRAAFYSAAVRRLWERRCPNAPKTLAIPRDRLLTALAGAMRLDRLDLPEEHFLEMAEATAGSRADALVEAVYASGILHPGATLATVQFRHLTFQEFYLARGLSAAPVRDTLFAHWTDPRYDETLALRLAMRCDDDRAAEADAALLALIDWGLDTYARSPEEVFALERSPMRSALHLIRRMGVGLARVPRAWERVRRLMEGSFLLALACANDQQAPHDILATLVNDSNIGIRLSVATNPATACSALAACAKDTNSFVAKAAVENPAFPSIALAKLAKCNKHYLRFAAASNPATPPDALFSLAHDIDIDVRRSAAENRETPPDALIALLKDSDPDVRRTAAKNRATPQDTLIAHLESLDMDLRAAIAENPAARPGTLAILANDADECVRWAVAQNPAAPPDVLVTLINDVNDVIRKSAIGHASIPPSVLTRIAKDTDEQVRASVAGNPATPSNILAIFANDPDMNVRWAAASNPRLPLEALAKLANDHIGWIRSAASGNLAAHPDLLAALARDANDSIRSAVGHNPATPPDALAVLARDTDYNVRWGAARNPATPPDALADLAKDTHDFVRQSAARNPAIHLEALTYQDW